MSEQDDPIVFSVSSGYANDPLAAVTRRSGASEPMYPEAYARMVADGGHPWAEPQQHCPTCRCAEQP